MKKSGTDSAPRVLVVDDEPDLRNLYELSLVREGYQILAAGSVAEARALMAEQSFDVLITDMNLPDGQGLELLHDIARAEKDHPAIGALWLRELGYPELSEIVRQHHDPDGTQIDEAAVVYIADKAVRGDMRCGIEERFAASLKKCATPEAREAHARRYETAMAIRNEINRLCEEELIP